MTLDKTYRNDLLVALRLQQVSDAKIDKTLAEVETHVADTGEDPTEVFGAPREYAERVAARLEPGDLKRVAAKVAAVGLMLLGLTYVLDGIWPEEPRVTVTSVDVVEVVLTIAAITVGTLLLYRGYTSSSTRTYRVLVSVGSVLALVVGYVLVKVLLGEGVVLFGIPPLGAIAVGAVSLVAAGFLGRAVQSGVFDPR